MRKALLNLLGARKREEIRKGRLWEIHRLWGFDLLAEEKQPAQPKAFEKPDALPVDKMRVHIIKPPDNITNLTKDVDFL